MALTDGGGIKWMSPVRRLFTNRELFETMNVKYDLLFPQYILCSAPLETKHGAD